MLEPRPAWPPGWPRVLDEHFGAPRPGAYRQSPEDFQVEENLGFTPQGEGEHLWLWVEKRDMTTAMVARQLADLCQVGPRDVGYAGMKDRVAVTRQWFSVHLPGRATPSDLADRLSNDCVTLLAQARHPRKLKRGVHVGNQFRLRLSGEAVEDPQLEARWAWLCRHGVANYFGPQRFGADGRNLLRAVPLLSKGWRKRDDPQGMLLSAARSYLFNTQLAERIANGSWATLLAGEVAVLDGSSSQFCVDLLDDELLARAERLDLHPSGVLWGQGDSRAQDAARDAECAALASHPALCRGIEHAGARLARRPLRLRLAAPALQRLADGAVWLSFGLPAGAFATSVLRELLDHPTLNFQPPSSKGHQQGAADAPTAAVQ
ncbi:tRNA pseudouridine(13) synthase TruD [Halomonas almeriensis]|uniref:tRNA pseudouridine(13) synthase TruD n=1 Tax=Halomonas almeriensis TaxID=308163 RepID=UPI0025B52669|nr:tRNA pseudouridine(13) synthase TruD [Halomonas almeriensis]MDN3553470.1 tRNA pseudouridine(13) synthase TruD [Halomonas almeriensis]